MNSSCSGGTPQARAAARAFGRADQRLDLEQIFRIRLTGLLGTQKSLHSLLEFFRLFFIDLEQTVELDGEIDEAPGVVIEDGDIAVGHVGDVDAMALARRGG